MGAEKILENLKNSHILFFQPLCTALPWGKAANFDYVLGKIERRAYPCFQSIISGFSALRLKIPA